MIEMMPIMLVSGAIVLPGAHKQFQQWYQIWIPLLLMMTGLHPALFLLQYIRMTVDTGLSQGNRHHYTALALCGWLLTVGPTAQLKW